MTRSVYVTGIDRGDGRQVVELGVMELLTRQVDRVGVFRPLVHDGPDRLFELLRARYRLSQDPATVYGMDYHEAVRAPGRAGHRRAGLHGSSTASTGWPATTTSSWSSAPTSPTPSSPTSWPSTPASPTSSAPP